MLYCQPLTPPITHNGLSIVYPQTVLKNVPTISFVKSWKSGFVLDLIRRDVYPKLSARSFIVGKTCRSFEHSLRSNLSLSSSTVHPAHEVQIDRKRKASSHRSIPQTSGLEDYSSSCTILSGIRIVDPLSSSSTPFAFCGQCPEHISFTNGNVEGSPQ